MTFAEPSPVQQFLDQSIKQVRTLIKEGRKKNNDAELIKVIRPLMSFTEMSQRAHVGSFQ